MRRRYSEHQNESGGKQFLLLHCRATARVRGVFFQQTPVVKGVAANLGGQRAQVSLDRVDPRKGHAESFSPPRPQASRLCPGQGGGAPPQKPSRESLGGSLGLAPAAGEAGSLSAGGGASGASLCMRLQGGLRLST